MIRTSHIAWLGLRSLVLKRSSARVSEPFGPRERRDLVAALRVAERLAAASSLALHDRRQLMAMVPGSHIDDDMVGAPPAAAPVRATVLLSPLSLSRSP